MKMGFTGTRDGMLSTQKLAVSKIIEFFQPDEFHHGDCIGSDAEAHFIARLHDSIWIVSHPPVIAQYRAYCKADVVKMSKPFLTRDKEIVKASNVLVATPKTERTEARSGTWSTIGYAKTANIPVFIVQPNGNVQVIGLFGLNGVLI